MRPRLRGCVYKRTACVVTPQRGRGALVNAALLRVVTLRVVVVRDEASMMVACVEMLRLCCVCGEWARQNGVVCVCVLNVEDSNSCDLVRGYKKN